MLCPQTTVESAEYCPAIEAEASGIEAEVLIWPAWTAEVHRNTKLLLATAEPIILPCIIEQSDLKMNGIKGGMKSELTVRLQNTEHNRGVTDALSSCRFLVGVKEIGKTKLTIFGERIWKTNQTMAKINTESIVVDFGKEFGSEKYIEFKIGTPLQQPIGDVTAVVANGVDVVSFANNTVNRIIAVEADGIAGGTLFTINVDAKFNELFPVIFPGDASGGFITLINIGTNVNSEVIDLNAGGNLQAPYSPAVKISTLSSAKSIEIVIVEYRSEGEGDGVIEYREAYVVNFNKLN